MSSAALEYWFRSQTLPWTDAIEDFLDEKGYETVEQLKFMKKEQWDELFADEKDVVKYTADQVYNDCLHEQKVDLKKAAAELHLKPAPPVNKTPAKKARHRDDGSSKKMNAFGFSVTVIKTGKQKEKEKKERKRKAGELLELSGDEGGDGGGDDGNKDVDNNDGDDSSDDDDNRKLPALPQSDWRSCRCALSQELNDPVPLDEKLIWDNSLLPSDKQPGKDVTDLEDTLGFYKAVGCTKTTSDEAFKLKVEEEFKNAKQKMTSFHPDRAETADAAKYIKWKEKYDMIRRVRKELCKVDDNGCFPNRVAYDKKGEELIDLMNEVSVAMVHLLSLLIPCSC